MPLPWNWTTSQKAQVPVMIITIACAIVILVYGLQLPRSKTFADSTDFWSYGYDYTYAIPATRQLSLAAAIPLLITTVPVVCALLSPKNSGPIYYTLNVVLVSLACIELTVVWIWTVVYVSMTDTFCNTCYTCPDTYTSSQCSASSFTYRCWSYTSTNTYVCNTYQPVLNVVFAFQIVAFVFLFVQSVLSCMIMNESKKQQQGDYSVTTTTIQTGAPSTTTYIQQPMMVQQQQPMFIQQPQMVLQPAQVIVAPQYAPPQYTPYA